MYPKEYFEQHKPQVESGRCFVLMPFAPQYAEVYDTIVEAIEGPDLNFECSRADELFGGGHILEDILRLIGTAEIVIADVTGRNPNVFYELGIAHMAKDLANVLILAQTMDDVPFDLRHYRCTKYEQSKPGLRQLKKDLILSVKEVAGVAYRFSMREDEGYEFPKKLFGRDRAKYEFEIKQIWIMEGAAKFIMEERRHVLGEPVQTVREDSYGIPTGGVVELLNVPWKLVLDETREGMAYFRVVAKR
jgi:hypothetical protein